MISIQQLLLFLFFVLWCFFHSSFISNQFIHYIKPKLGKHFKAYRLLYNLFSLITFLALLWYSYSLKSAVIFNWSGYFQILHIILLLVCFFLFFAGSLAYDIKSFLGFRQIKQKEHRKGMSNDGKISTTGILGIIRHPWYTATFLLIWARNWNVNTLIINIILSIYLVIGCYLEEKKLVLEYGEGYQNYQKNVSMLFPWKWLQMKLNR
ncbi:hypothetical protein BZG02_14650 [Labilibaculum filiforme]|uniref:NnrU domain-containing protein n=1 Tax=Labilibaculum filiforme TaxID=1940526 RepID=A0A2N3HUY1_9BACT|nr:hypothetical protein BZG02_14650 [Labilibaculum filiforme]